MRNDASSPERGDCFRDGARSEHANTHASSFSHPEPNNGYDWSRRRRLDHAGYLGRGQPGTKETKAENDSRVAASHD